ncbi:MAG: hypothetical protein NUW01_13000 [Gemmatimonadaceae bacterium]|nr:hypothetical protein [Gemmatimonadaceae bacterium]
MATPTAPPDRRRTRLVYLRDVPASIRFSAADRLCRAENDPGEREAIFAVAVDPGDYCAWIAA